MTRTSSSQFLIVAGRWIVAGLIGYAIGLLIWWSLLRSVTLKPLHTTSPDMKQLLAVDARFLELQTYAGAASILGAAIAVIVLRRTTAGQMTAALMTACGCALLSSPIRYLWHSIYAML